MTYRKRMLQPIALVSKLIRFHGRSPASTQRCPEAATGSDGARSNGLQAPARAPVDAEDGLQLAHRQTEPMGRDRLRKHHEILLVSKGLILVEVSIDRDAEAR